MGGRFSLPYRLNLLIGFRNAHVNFSSARFLVGMVRNSIASGYGRSWG